MIKHSAFYGLFTHVTFGDEMKELIIQDFKKSEIESENCVKHVPIHYSVRGTVIFFIKAW